MKRLTDICQTSLHNPVSFHYLVNIGQTTTVYSDMVQINKNNAKLNLQIIFINDKIIS